ncbi:MAG: helix-turn-helix domain-containing protein [Acidobacteriota bacterium]
MNNKRLKLFGSRLKETIEEKGMTVNEISRATKIRKVFIEALINGDKENLPDNVFVIGYLKAILDFLKVDKDSFIEEYKAMADSGEVSEGKVKEDFSPLPEFKSKSHCLLWTAVIGFILALSAFFLFRVSILEMASNILSKIKNTEEFKTVTVKPENTTQKKEAPLETKEEKNTPVDNLSPISQEGLVIKASSNCWIELFDEKGKVLMKREISKGEELNFNGKKFTITMGDPSALELFIDGKAVDIPKDKGKVVRNFSVSGDSK